MKTRVAVVVVAVVALYCVAVLYTLRSVQGSRPDVEYLWGQHDLLDNSGGFSLACGDNGLAYAASWEGGIRRTTDGGKHWTDASDGITDCWVNAVAVGPNGKAYAGTGRGVYRSINNGKHWALWNDGLTDLGIYDVYTDASGRVYAHTSEKRLLRRSDGDRRWTRIDTGRVKNNCCSLAFEPGRRLFVGTYDGRVFRSDDDGKTWRKMTFPKPRKEYWSASQIAVAKSGSIFLRDSADLFRLSADGNQCVKLIVPSLGSLVGLGTDIRTFCRTETGRLIVGTDSGVAYSDNDGETWASADCMKRIIVAYTPAQIVRIAADGKGRIYAIDTSGSVFAGTRNPRKDHQ